MGEMVAFLPIPGAVFTLADRLLTREIVRHLQQIVADTQGFACGVAYWIAGVTDFANKGLTFANYMSYWTAAEPAIFVTIFYPLPILFNTLNVRRYGEIEYWLTVIKILTVIGLILAGAVIAFGGSPNPLLGTTREFRPVRCDDQMKDCLQHPGLSCSSPL